MGNKNESNPDGRGRENTTASPPAQDFFARESDFPKVVVDLQAVATKQGTLWT